MFIPFNANDVVRIKLNAFGRKCIRLNHERILSHLPSIDIDDLPPPVEDVNGWSSWTLGNIMTEFGSHMHVGGDFPWDAFEFRVKDNPPTTGRVKEKL